MDTSMACGKKHGENTIQEDSKEAEMPQIKNKYGTFCPRCRQRQNDYYGIKKYCPACGQKLGFPKE